MLELRAKSLIKNSEIREGGKLKRQPGNKQTVGIVFPQSQRPEVPEENATCRIYFSIIQS